MHRHIFVQLLFSCADSVIGSCCCSVSALKYRTELNWKMCVVRWIANSVGGGEGHKGTLMIDYVGWDWRLRTAAITGLLFIPWVNVSEEPWWLRCRLGKAPDSSTRTLWQSYHQRYLERVGGIDERMRISFVQYLLIRQRIFYMP
jgi:hypothetical protein